MAVLGFVPPRSMPAGKKKPALVRSPFNNIRPYKPIRPGEPVPEPLPPAPLLGPKELLALGALVVAQAWGALNSRPLKNIPIEYVPGLVITGAVPPAGNTVGATVTIVQSSATWQVYGQTNNICVPGASGTFSGGTVTRQNVVAVAPYSTDGPCGKKDLGFSFTYPNGFVENAVTMTTGGFGVLKWTGTAAIAWDNPAAVPYQSTAEIDLPDGYIPPSPEVKENEKTLPAPLPSTPSWTPRRTPATTPSTPADPQISPSVVPTTPGPSAPPATQPLVPRRTVPLPIPGATPTKDGAIVPQAPAPIAVTPSDAHFPVPGGAPVLGNGPQPKPETIAQELGRLEQKLARLSDPGPGGPSDGSDRLQLLSDLIGRLIEFATSMTSGGGYSLSSPCELDENGDRIVTTVEYPGDTNSLGVLSNKIDALAGVLQIHKDLKQPNCKQPAAVGQPVTVNFVQVD
jgi:hypothetical protein